MTIRNPSYGLDRFGHLKREPSPTQHFHAPLKSRSHTNAIIALLALLGVLAFCSEAAATANLTLEDGVVVKFGANSGLTVRQGLQTRRGVVLTSLSDDAASGRTGPSQGTPAAGDWRGLTIEDSVAAGDLQIDRLELRYAGANGAAALQLAKNYAIQFLKISDSLLGIRVTGGARPTFSGLSLIGNAIGLESREDASPTLSGSEAVSNTDFGVLNLSSQALVKAGNTWWGSASGPTAADNANGTGDKVSAGVTYLPFATTVPLIDCSLAVIDGAATVTQPSVMLALDCRNAVEYRLALNGGFGSAPYLPIAQTATFALSGSAGDRTIAVEYRAATSNVKTAQITVHYQPNAPVVVIDAPAEGATIRTDTTIEATVSDAAGIDRVEFSVDGTQIGIDTAAPYELLWPITGFQRGQRTIKVFAVSLSGQSSAATRIVDLQPPGDVDIEGPQIADVSFAGEPLTDGTVVRAPGTLRFRVTDPSGVDPDSVGAELDNIALLGGVFADDEYAVEVGLDNLPDGINTLVLSARDVLGNSTVQSISIEVDTSAGPQAPVVTITAPASGAQIGDDTVIAANVTGVNIRWVDFFVDGEAIGRDATPPYEQLWQIGATANGSHEIKVVATNTADQQGQAIQTVTVQHPPTDTTGPTIGDVRFDGQPLTEGAAIAASGTLTFTVDDLSGVASAGVRVDGQTATGGTLGGTTYSIALTLTGGNHALVLQAADTLGNPSEQTWHVHVEPSSPTAPVVTVTAPTGGTSISDDTLITASVTGANIRWVDFFVDGEAIGRDATPPYEQLWQIGAVANGSHEIKVVATNTADQQGQAIQTVTVQHPPTDTTGPTIGDVRFDGQPLTEGATIAASGTLTFTVDDLSGVASAGVRIDGQPATGGVLNGTSYSIALSLADGDHTIVLQAADTPGNSSEQTWHVRVETASTAPTVTITAPAANAQISADTTIAASVVGEAITRVDFYVDTGWIGAATAAPYQTLWSVAGFANGPHTLQAIATNANGQIGRASVPINLQRVSNDTVGPEISDVRFAGQPLSGSTTLTAPGLLTFRVTDASGVASGAVRIGSTAVTGGGLNQGQYSTLLDFNDVVNGSYAITLTAVDTVGNSSEQVLPNITVTLPPPPTPILLSPVDATTTPQPNVAVAGTAQASSQVQLFLDGGAVGGPIAVPFHGSFNRTIVLPEEGTHALTATASNSRGTSAATAPVSITYSAPSPSVVLTWPPEGARIEADGVVAIEASVVDAVGVRSATLKIDGHAVGTVLSQPPYAWSWTVDGSVADGEHAIEVTVVNVVNKSATVARTVTVARTPVIPPVQTAYVGEVSSISPTSSYGNESIVVSGRAVDTTSGEPVPNALLKVVLKVNGFQRRINTSTNASGVFTYRFVPQNSDSGVYVVSVIHPNQTDLPNQGQFTINRLGLSPPQYALRAARTIPQTIRYTVSASPGEGTSGLYFEAVPADQPSGTGLPAGISIQAPAAIDVPPGGSVPIDVVFTAGTEAQAPASTGTVVLRATDGGGRARGTVTINYSLSEPQAYLLPQPSGIQTGVKRGKQVNESVQLSNRGLITARNVVVSLSSAPSWVRLASPSNLGDLAVGASQPIQLVAAPTSDIGDDIYQLSIHVQADGLSGDIPVAIAVTSAEIGAVQFHAKDIYTCLPDCDATPGLANASIRIQNEQVYTETRSGTTDAQGLLQIADLPTGHYRYVANAPNHVSATGRFTVRPVVTLEQPVFLDYELVTFEWTVTETTIRDRYDVTLTASYQTQVPAPVMLIEPASINVPDMQEGEELTGEITISNLGLVRADNVTWFPALSDAYFEVEFLGTPPDTFDAHQSYRLPYRLTKKCTPLPGMEGGPCPGQSQVSVLFGSVKSGATTTAGGCNSYRNPMHVEFGYQCAAGDTRSGSAWSGLNKAYGQGCGGGGGSTGGGNGGNGGGWGGGGVGGGPAGTPMSSGPGCVPECPDCDGGGPGG